jgi:hypothetical protein
MSTAISSLIRSLVVACGLLLCVAASAQAQKALTHSIALNGLGGCDTPGYPLTICRPGSYKLASDLRVPNDTDGVEIQVSLVTLDLNGFSIYQSGTCRSGDGMGIRTAPALTAVTVKNGTVSCHGRNGISLLGGKHRVEQITAIANNLHGIDVGEDSLVTDSNATENGFDGIRAAASSLVLGNIARANGRFGLLLAGTTGWGSNVLTGNPGNFDEPVQVIGGVQMGHNVCNGVACR